MYPASLCFGVISGMQDVLTINAK